jgi:hypothetical protein
MEAKNNGTDVSALEKAQLDVLLKEYGQRMQHQHDIIWSFPQHVNILMVAMAAVFTTTIGFNRDVVTLVPTIAALFLCLQVPRFWGMRKLGVYLDVLERRIEGLAGNKDLLTWSAVKDWPRYNFHPVITREKAGGTTERLLNLNAFCYLVPLVPVLLGCYFGLNQVRDYLARAYPLEQQRLFAVYLAIHIVPVGLCLLNIFFQQLRVLNWVRDEFVCFAPAAPISPDGSTNGDQASASRK